MAVGFAEQKLLKRHQRSFASKHRCFPTVLNGPISISLNPEEHWLSLRLRFAPFAFICVK